MKYAICKTIWMELFLHTFTTLPSIVALDLLCLQLAVAALLRGINFPFPIDHTNLTARQAGMTIYSRP